MRQGTRAEFEAARATPHAEIRRFFGGRGRVVDTEITLGGRVLATGTVVYAGRSKVVGETYLVLEDRENASAKKAK